MELSLICPVKHIEHTSLLAGRFCVAPIALKHPAYWKYFVEAAEAGYNVILDNGVFESDKVQDEDYINLARQLKPRVLVAPDTINAGVSENLNTANLFADMVMTEELNNSLPEPIELMHVVQCEKGDDDGFWKVIGEILTGHTFQWIGICRDAVYNAFSQYTHTEDQELNRFYFAARLMEAFPGTEGLALILGKKWHFLGVGKQLNLLQYYWFVDAMDTASFFYQATLRNGITPEGILPGVLKRPVDYFTRDFGIKGCWLDKLEHNCVQALCWAQRADRNRRKILGGRL